jgi:hypothetical protein
MLRYPCTINGVHRERNTELACWITAAAVWAGGWVMLGEQRLHSLHFTAVRKMLPNIIISSIAKGETQTKE